MVQPYVATVASDCTIHQRVAVEKPPVGYSSRACILRLQLGYPAELGK